MPKFTNSATAARGRLDAVHRIDEACRRAVLGKLAVRDVAGWVAEHGISETEFRVLWRLLTGEDAAGHQGHTKELDQTDLAAELAVSPAQVSAVVDRLRQANRIAAAPTADRRRQMWRLTPAGRDLLHTIVMAVASAPAAQRDKEAA
jgi:DNA-binding MarR family transcriptional regulator